MGDVWNHEEKKTLECPIGVIGVLFWGGSGGD